MNTSSKDKTYEVFYPQTDPNKQLSYAQWLNVLTDEEIKKIVDYCKNKLEIKRGTVLSEGLNNNTVRKSNITWIDRNDETEWIFERMNYLLQKCNSDMFGFELTGFHGIQFTEYDSSEEGFYIWHTDHGPGLKHPRKLSMSVQLSDPSDYEGGDLELWGDATHTAVKDKGSAHFFPAYVLHRVTPVTKGIRHSLVVWAVGPHFR